MLVLTVPALTMRLISDENRMGTLELLLTAPVQDWELIVGKWLGGLLFLFNRFGRHINLSDHPQYLRNARNKYSMAGSEPYHIDPLPLWRCSGTWSLAKGWRLCSSYWESGSLPSSPAILLYHFTVPGIDWGLTCSSYLGLFLVCAAFLGLGVGISSLFSNQVAAFFVTS